MLIVDNKADNEENYFKQKINTCEMLERNLNRVNISVFKCGDLHSIIFLAIIFNF